MALEIGLKTIPASAMGLVKEPKVQPTEPGVAPQDAASVAALRVSDNRNDSQEQKVSELKTKVSQLNESVQDLRRELHFEVDEESGRVVIKVVSAEDGETIRQIPEEELLNLAKHLTEGETEGSLLKVIA